MNTKKFDAVPWKKVKILDDDFVLIDNGTMDFGYIFKYVNDGISVEFMYYSDNSEEYRLSRAFYSFDYIY